jgi:hypothetical protein
MVPFFFSFLVWGGLKLCFVSSFFVFVALRVARPCLLGLCFSSPVDGEDQ